MWCGGTRQKIRDEKHPTIFQLKGRKRQPPKSGSQNARRALVETEFVWETSSALFLVSSGSLPPMLPSLSSTPRCRWSRKHHSMSRKQDDGERMGTLAAVRVSSYRVEPHHHSGTAVALCQLARHFQPQATLPQDPASSCTRLRRKTCAALGRKAPCSARIRSRGSKV